MIQKTVVYDLEHDIEQIQAIKEEVGPEKGEDAGGAVFAVWKPSGMSTFDVIRRLKKEVGFTKIGHGGTLDPMAEGVVVIGVGRGTKEVWKIPQDKIYVAEFMLGRTSETLDTESEVFVLDDYGVKEGQGSGVDLEGLESEGLDLSQDCLEKIIVEQFIGEIDQVPPKYSAKKVDGKRAYKLARAGASDEEVGLQSCRVEVFSVEVVEYVWPRLAVRVHCGKGTYIRSLGDDIGRAFGVGGAVMSKLVRVSSGGFVCE